jgi:hypothetical protein
MAGTVVTNAPTLATIDLFSALGLQALSLDEDGHVFCPAHVLVDSTR